MTHPSLGNSPEIGAPPSRENRIRPHRQVWAIAVAAGAAAALLSWLGGELVHNAFKPQLFSIKIAFTTYIQPTAASLNTADFKNASLVFTVLGGVTAAAMGIAGGIAGRSLGRGLVVGLGGLVAGSLVGALASLGLLPIFFRRAVPDPNDLVSPIIIHGGIWMAIGAVGGLAFALGMRCGRAAFNAMAGACFGALIATLLYHGLGEALFPDSGSTTPLATSAVVRLMAVILVAVLIAIGAARGALGRVSHPGSSGKDPSPELS